MPRFTDSCREVGNGLFASTSMQWASCAGEVNTSSCSPTSTRSAGNPRCGMATGAGGIQVSEVTPSGTWTQNAMGAKRQSLSKVKRKVGDVTMAKLEGVEEGPVLAGFRRRRTGVSGPRAGARVARKQPLKVRQEREPKTWRSQLENVRAMERSNACAYQLGSSLSNHR